MDRRSAFARLQSGKLDAASELDAHRRLLQSDIEMEDKRKVIIDKATELFEKHGYHAVGIDRIIAESNVAKMTMYRHFPSKSHLIQEVLEHRADVFRNSLTERINKARNPLARVKAVFDWHDDWFHSTKFAGCMFAHAASEFNDKQSDIHQTAAVQKTELTALVRDLLRESVGTRKATELARVVVMLLDGAMLAAQICDRPSAASEAWSAAKFMIEAAICV